MMKILPALIAATSLAPADKIRQDLQGWAIEAGVADSTLSWLYPLLGVCAICLLAYLCAAAFRYVVQPLVLKVVEKTAAKWDDYLLNPRVLRAVRRLIPPLVCYSLFPLVFARGSSLLAFLLKVSAVYLVIVSILLVTAFIRSLYDISNEHRTLRDRPLKGVYQMATLVTFLVGIIIVVSIIMDTNLTTIVAGLGASAAVMALVFRDTILGLVAGVQLTANDMLRPGDWITMERHEANGFVKEVTLTTVKVQNFDNTITTIPPYLLVSESFRNMRAMWNSGGRRMKVSIHLDANSLRFCSPEELAGYAERGYIDDELARSAEPVANTEAFRDHMLRYMNRHPDANGEYLSMVRMLQPTPEGLPMELYCFCRYTEWKPFERFQSQVLDYALVVAREFGLRIYQRVASGDVKS